MPTYTCPKCGGKDFFLQEETVNEGQGIYNPGAMFPNLNRGSNQPPSFTPFVAIPLTSTQDVAYCKVCEGKIKMNAHYAPEESVPGEHGIGYWVFAIIVIMILVIASTN